MTYFPPSKPGAAYYFNSLVITQTERRFYLNGVLVHQEPIVQCSCR